MSINSLRAKLPYVQSQVNKYIFLYHHHTHFLQRIVDSGNKNLFIIENWTH